MADEYRGLYVRFGGDTTKLQSALKAAESAAAKTQRQLTQVNKAMRFDSGNVGNAETKLKMLSNRAESLGSQLKVTRTAYRQLASTEINGKKVAELAQETNNASLAAANANQRYNAVNKELEKMYRLINEVGKESFGDAFDIRESEDIDGMVDSMRSLGIITDEVADRVHQLRASWADAFDELKSTQAVLQLEQMGNKCQALDSEIKGLVGDMARLKVPSDIAQGFATTKQQVERIDASIRELEADMKRADAALSLDPSNIAAAQRKMSDLAAMADLSAQKAALLSREMDGYKDAGVDAMAKDMGNVAQAVTETTAEWERQRAALEAARGELSALAAAQKSMEDAGKTTGDAYDEMKADVTEATLRVEQLEESEREANAARQSALAAGEYQELAAQISEADSAVRGYTDAMADAGEKSGLTMTNVKTMGMTLSAVLTPAMEEVGRRAIDSAQNVDSAYRDMRKTVNGTDADFKALKQSAIDFSTTHVTSADQILSIQAIGGELGITTDNLEEFAQVVSNIDVATDLNAEEGAEILGHLSNITRDTADNMTGFSDALVRLGNNGASTESDIGEIAERIGSMGSIVGMSTPDILAWSATIAATGQKAEAAGTAISNTMSDMETAVSAGGDALQGFASVANMSAEDFAATWENNPTQALKAFIEGLNEVEASGGSADAALEELGIKGTRQKQAIMGLMQTIGGLNDNLEMSNNAWNGVSDQWGQAGDAANEANKKAEGLSGTISQLENIAQDAGSILGDAMAPSLASLTDTARDALKWLSGLNDEGKQMIVWGGGIAAALGPGLSVIATMGTGISAAMGKVSSGKTAWAEMVRSVSMANGVLGESASASESAAAAISGLTTKQKLLATGSGLLTKATSILKGGLVALVAAGVVFAIDKFAEAKKAEREFAEATESASSIMGTATGNAAKMGDAIGDVSIDADGCVESMRKLNDSAKETLDTFYTDKTKLDQYVSTINELAGKSTLSATEQWRLQQAVDGYNSITGNSITITGDLNDKISDGSWRLSENTDKIKENTDAWAKKAKAEALASLASQYLEEELKSSRELALAQEQLAQKKERLATLQDKFKNLTINPDEVVEMYKLNDEVSKLQDNVSTLQGTNSAAAASYAYLTAQAAASAAGLSEEAQELSGNIAEAMTKMGSNVGDALSGVGIDMSDLSVKLAEAGVSTEQLNQIGSTEMAALAASCGGSIDNLIWRIQNYNGTPIVDKQGNILVNDAQLMDAQGNVYVWNGTELIDKTGNVVVDEVELSDAQNNVYAWNGQKLENKTATASTKFSEVTKGTAAIEEQNDTPLNDKSNEVSSSYSSVNDASRAMRDQMNMDFHDRSNTITTTIVTKHENAAGGIPHANGGVVGAVAYHARGFIANRATDVTRHIAGEAGAEAIIPLTNRRYTGPFVGMISDAVVAALEGRISELASGQDQTRALVSAIERAGEKASASDAAANVAMSAQQVCAWLGENLPFIIGNYTPVIGSRDFSRMVNDAVR